MRFAGVGKVGAIVPAAAFMAIDGALHDQPGGGERTGRAMFGAQALDQACNLAEASSVAHHAAFRRHRRTQGLQGRIGQLGGHMAEAGADEVPA